MQQRLSPLALHLKPLFAGVVGILAWTLSIHIVPITLEAQPINIPQCDSTHTTQYIFDSMVNGIVTQMYNDGVLLTISISDDWNAMSHDSRRHLYHMLQCLAKQKNVALHVLPLPIHTSSP